MTPADREVVGSFRIFSVSGGFTLSSDAGWFPGFYDSRDTALIAIGMIQAGAEAKLVKMQNRVNQAGGDRIITRDMLTRPRSEER